MASFRPAFVSPCLLLIRSLRTLRSLQSASLAATREASRSTTASSPFMSAETASVSRRRSPLTRRLRAPCLRDRPLQIVIRRGGVLVHAAQLLEKIRRPLRTLTDSLLQRANDETVPADAEGSGQGYEPLSASRIY